MELADLFSKHETETLTTEWGTVRSIYSLPSGTTGAKIKMSQGSLDIPVQGIALHSKRHPIAVNGITANRIELWTDTAPTPVTLAWNDAAQVRVWNIWRGGKGVTQAWLRSSGMIICEKANTMTLKCSWGRAVTPDFESLTAEIALHRHGG